MQLELYAKINFGILLGSLVLCLLLWLCGTTMKYIHNRVTGAPKLPKISRFGGSCFPHLADEVYTLLFIIFFATCSLSDILIKTTEMSAAESWSAVFFMLFIYLPMGLRYMSLPIAQIGTTRQNLCKTLIALLTIYFCISVLTVAGYEQWLTELTHTPATQQVADDIGNSEDPLTIAALLISAIIIAPVMEEFAFRGFLYNILRGKVGKIAAMLASSLFFAAIHVSLMQTLPLFIFACVQCILYEKTGSIRYSILLHATFNTITTIFIFLK